MVETFLNDGVSDCGSYHSDTSNQADFESDSEYSCTEFDSSDDEKLPFNPKQWCKIKCDAQSPDVTPSRFNFTGCPGVKVHVDENTSPLDFFKLYIDDELVDHICTETNRFAKGSGLTEWINVSRAELYLLFGLKIHLGIVNMPKEVMHWSKDPLFEMSIFRSIMSFKRYSKIMQYLQFTNNKTYDPLTHPNPKLNKIYEVYLNLEKKFRSFYEPKRDLCIVENLLTYKTRLRWTQPNPLNRTSFGIRNFLLCEATTGYVWSFILSAGNKTKVSSELKKLDSNPSCIAMTLMKPLLGKGHCLIMNRNYTSPYLVDLLVSHETDVYGAVKPTKKHLPSQINKTTLENDEIIAYRKGKVMALRWKGRQDVTMLSTIHNTKVVQVKTHSKTINKPEVIYDYNAIMGSAEINCVMQSTSKEKELLYKKFFFHMLDMAVRNSYLLYNASGNKKLSSLDYRIMLVRSIFQTYRPELPPPNSGRPSIHDHPARYTSGHFPTEIPPTKLKKAPTRQCVVCAKKRDINGKKNRRKTRYQCKICKQALCVVPCFEKYHTP